MIKVLRNKKIVGLMLFVLIIGILNGCSDGEIEQHFFEGEGEVWKAQYSEEFQEEGKFIIKYELIDDTIETEDIIRAVFSYGTSEASQVITYNNIEGGLEKTYFVEFDYQEDMLNKMQDDYMLIIVAWEDNNNNRTRDSFNIYRKEEV
jgi:hypothetical protein